MGRKRKTYLVCDNWLSEQSVNSGVLAARARHQYEMEPLVSNTGIALRE